MRIWSWTVDDWNTAFQVLTTIFVAGTVLTGLGTVFTGRLVNKRHAEELAATKASTIRLETDLAIQQERAAKAEKELLEIKERFRPRTLTQSQQNNFFGLARAYAPLAKEAREKRGEYIWVVHPRGDPEATEFASMLGHLLFQAEWPVQIHDIPFPVHTIGLSFLVRDPANPPQLLQPLQNLFNEMKLPVTIRKEKDIDGKAIFLEVGFKH